MKTKLALSCALLFSLNCLANTPPVPVLHIVNAVEFPDDWGGANIVITKDRSNATVILDGSESFDADGDSLMFLLGYFDEGRFYRLPGTEWTEDPLFTLRKSWEDPLGFAVADGQGSVVILRVYINIDTVEEYAEDIKDAINERELESRISIRGKHLLLEPLERAVFFFERGNYWQGALFMRLFQARVRTHPWPLDPSLGANSRQSLIAIADELLNAIEISRTPGHAFGGPRLAPPRRPPMLPRKTMK